MGNPIRYNHCAGEKPLVIYFTTIGDTLDQYTWIPTWKEICYIFEKCYMAEVGTRGMHSPYLKPFEEIARVILE